MAVALSQRRWRRLRLSAPLGYLAEQTDGAGTLLASFAYDSQGVPTSVQVGSDPATAPRYYYVYNGHGDVVALTDARGTPVAAYGDDAWGAVTVDTEHFATGWRNPYLYDGRDGARYDVETGLYWLSVRAYDPTLGRFLSHDPLGRAPLFFADQPYAYAGNNPLVNVDPSGQRFATESHAQARTAVSEQRRVARIEARRPAPKWTPCGSCASWIAGKASSRFTTIAWVAAVAAAAIGLLSVALSEWAVGAALTAAGAAATGFGFFAFIALAAVAAGAALLARQAAYELGIVTSEAAGLAAFFGEASHDPISYRWEHGFWRTAVLGTLLVGSATALIAGFVVGLRGVAQAIKPLVGLLDKAVVHEVFTVLALFGGPAGAFLSTAGLATLTFGYLRDMESYLKPR